MDWRFWKRKPTLVCQWGETRGLETCDGRVYWYDCVDSEGNQDKPRRLCNRHMWEKKRSLDKGETLTRRK